MNPAAIHIALEKNHSPVMTLTPPDLTALPGTPTERVMAERDSKNPIEDSMDLLRLLEYPQLLGKTYLDHAGATQPAKSLNTAICEDVSRNLYGNPHSEHTPSQLAHHRVQETRLKALEFFHADPHEWDLIFTQNTTAALKLVHDCFRDHAAAPHGGGGAGRNWWFGYHKDSHTSVVGVREGTRLHRCFRNDREVDLWIESRGLGGAMVHDLGLFAYPAQSNMTGRRLPLDWPARIRSRVKAETYTLLDAAAYTSTAELNLSDAARAPDFVALSFYKIFGAPYIGCLLVKKSARKVMESRRYFGGGTVDMVIAVNDSWVKRKGKKHLHERLEDGTLPLRQIFELDHAIDIHRKLYGPSPMKYISMHTTRLIKRLHDDLVDLRHSNGLPVVKVYTDSGSVFGDAQLQGATIAFNIQKDRGGLVKYYEVEKEANAQGIHVRSGSLCNPGGTATYLQWSPTELREAFAYGHSCSSPQAEYSGKALGVVRVSLGAMSSDADIARLVQFVRETYVDRVYDSGGPICLPGDVLAADAPIAKGVHVSEQKEAARMSSRISSDSACTLTAETALSLSLSTSNVSKEEEESKEEKKEEKEEKEEERCSVKSKASRTERLCKSIGDVFRCGSRRQGIHRR